MKYVKALTIAGSDSVGGAGIQADLKTMSALGVYGMSVITAVTAQNTLGVGRIMVVTPNVVADQIDRVMTDCPPDAIKIGMVNDRETIDTICRTLSKYPYRHLVVDPVMVATSGDVLMKDDALTAFEQRMLPLTTLLTPNIPEAERLSGIVIRTQEDIRRAAKTIQEKGCRNVLIKGGHLEGEKTDFLFEGDDIQAFPGQHIPSRNTHGTGCTLSAAITSYLAVGLSLREAVTRAKDYISEAIAQGADIDEWKGHGPVNHFFNPQPLRKKS